MRLGVKRVALLLAHQMSAAVRLLVAHSTQVKATLQGRCALLVIRGLSFALPQFLDLYLTNRAALPHHARNTGKRRIRPTPQTSAAFDKKATTPALVADIRISLHPTLGLADLFQWAGSVDDRIKLAVAEERKEVAGKIAWN